MSQNNQHTHLWLRDETKPQEHRTALTPQDARRLVAAGFKLTVESSEVRIFSDDEYVKASCSLVAPGSWRNAPENAFILGLKELPEEQAPLKHRHIYFAHAYKEQNGWKELLTRFKQGGGQLLDLEYLTTNDGRRVAAFGRWAGFAGAAVGLMTYAHTKTNTTMAALKPYPKQDDLVQATRALMKDLAPPKIMVIGARGRCGTGALDMLEQAGMSHSNITAWDIEDTVAGGPFEAILKHDILVNCVLVQGKTNPFLTPELLTRARNLCVVSDVSCDPLSPMNPLPIYKSTTTFMQPVTRLIAQTGPQPALDLTAIDHLPSLLPRESSEDFSSQLLPHLMTLSQGSDVWERPAVLFNDFSRKA